MPKASIYELAKKFGVDSRTILSTLKDMGEFVKSASSTVEAPVVKQLEQKFQKSASPKPQKDHAPKPQKAFTNPRKPFSHEASKVSGNAPRERKPEAPTSSAPKPAAPSSPLFRAPTLPSTPMPQDFSKRQGPRPGNNPFSSTQGMHFPTPTPDLACDLLCPKECDGNECASPEQYLKYSPPFDRLKIQMSNKSLR